MVLRDKSHLVARVFTSRSPTYNVTEAKHKRGTSTSGQQALPPSANSAQAVCLLLRQAVARTSV
eukprot:2829790-Amphidinium_carterae.1